MITPPTSTPPEDRGPVALPVARQLPRQEWERLRTFGPFAEAGVLPDPRFALIEVLEEGGEGGPIVGSWMVTPMAILEGLYLAEDWRAHPAAARRLFFGMMELLGRYEITTVLTVTQDPAVRALAHKAGFTDLPGQLQLLQRMPVKRERG